MRRECNAVDSRELTAAATIEGARSGLDNVIMS
jgi:hypothetical protein